MTKICGRKSLERSIGSRIDKRTCWGVLVQSTPKIAFLKNVSKVVRSAAWLENEYVCKLAHPLLERICGQDGNARDGDLRSLIVIEILKTKQKTTLRRV